MSTILIMEDNEPIRQAFTLILESAGYKICGASDGVEGLAILRTEIIDLILTDGEMPRMDGYTAIQMIKDNPATAHLPVILITASDPQTAIQEAMRQRADLHLTKPVTPKTLLAAIKQLL